ncbi:MAG: hypothetical protein IJU36_03850 [Paludibacteraceae bacterium]|nr:hypothetical protein [Paludibacteraceae bacterium]
MDKYIQSSPYAYCDGNPLKYVDPEGSFVTVTANEDGTYTTYSGELDGDLNVYVVDKDGYRTGEVIGQTLTPYTFFDNNENFIVGAKINLLDESGQEFLNHVTIDYPDPISYALQALPNGDYDFKNIGYEVPMSKTIYHYRAMPINLFDGNGTKIATARDIGNFAAGFIAGREGVTWENTRKMFDLVQGKFIRFCPEPNVSTSAQRAGYDLGFKWFGQYMK